MSKEDLGQESSLEVASESRSSDTSRGTHTPTPWMVDGEARYAGFRIIDGNKRSVAAFPSTSTRPPEERNANAALIVKAVNNHAQLVGMLQDVLEYLDGDVDVIDGPEGQQLPNRAMRLVQEIEGVLAKAGAPK